MNPVAESSTSHTTIQEAPLDEEPPGSKPPPFVFHGVQVLCQRPPEPVVPLPTFALRPPRGVVILYSQTEKLGQADNKDLLADLETIATARAVAQVLRQYTDLEVHLVPALRQVETKLRAYPPEDYLVFNLFEGTDGLVDQQGNSILDEEARAAFVLQTLKYRFTGADHCTIALAANKAQAKAALKRGGVLTPPWRVFAHPDEVSDEFLENLAFPLIVKPVAEDSSLGIDVEAVVSDLQSLRKRVALITKHYRQNALVESFIDGREFNVALWGNPPQVLPLAEVNLSALGSPEKRIVSFAAKWEESSFEYQHTPVICPAIVSDDLAARIQDTALRAWEIVGGRCGYGRVDMRVRDGQVYVLEVNPNPSIAPDAGFARAARAAGIQYPQMILRILSLIQEDAHVYHSPS